jgi:hypothetical protein
MKACFPRARSFFTVLDAHSFDQANLDPLPIASKFSENYEHDRKSPASFRRDDMQLLDSAIRKQRNVVPASTDLAELLGCEPCQIDSNRMQAYGTTKPELKSTIKAMQLSFRDGLAHNVIFE